MKKSDLKDGMIVELRNGKRRFILNELLIEVDLYKTTVVNSLIGYDDDLYCSCVNSLDIIKIFYNNEVLWERKEIDWSKVPIGTKILFSINGGEYTEGLFIKKDGNKFIVCDDIKNRLFTSCNYCKLAEESKEEVTYKELENKYNDFEDVECGECSCCKYKESNVCEFAWILDNYNVTRK